MQQGVKHTIKKDGSYFLTLTVVDWIDIFTTEDYQDIIIDSFRYCIKNKGLNVYSYCLMPNHLHFIANTDEPFLLKDVIRDFKKFTSKEILRQHKQDPNKAWMLKKFETAAFKSRKHKSYKFWQAGSHAIELFNERFTWIKINYIHNNPVKAGFVDQPEGWKYSSATNYLELKSVLPEVHCLSGPVKRV